MFKKSNLKFMKSFFLHTHLFWLKYEYAMVKYISINSFENLLAFNDLNWYQATINYLNIKMEYLRDT